MNYILNQIVYRVLFTTTQRYKVMYVNVTFIINENDISFNKPMNTHMVRSRRNMFLLTNFVKEKYFFQKNEIRRGIDDKAIRAVGEIKQSRQ